MRRFVGFWALLLLTFAPRASSQQAARPGMFDYYLFTLSWSPEYCYSNRASSECNLGQHYGFVVHGLWPEFQNGGYPEHCSDAPGLMNPTSMLGIMPDIKLIQHEWSTHGTCTGLNAEDYFGLIRKTHDSIKIPNEFSGPRTQMRLSPMQIKADFERLNTSLQDADIRIMCSRDYLTSVEICLTKDLKPMACPAARTCPASMLKVQPVRYLPR